MKGTWFVIILLAGAVALQGCESEESPAPVDCAEDPVTVSVVSVDDATCNQTDGSIEVKASGGSGNYRFKMDGGAAQTSSVFTNVGAGIYEITAVDANDCSGTVEVAVANLNGLNITFEASAAGCKTTDGSISVTAFDGAEPYQFKLQDGAFTTSNTFSSLSTGTYTLLVKDAAGCEISQAINIRSGVSFASSVSPIITDKCAINACHNGSQFPDLRVFKNIRDNASKIKTVTGNGTMPLNGSLTQNEIDMIACWVDDGAPDN